MAYLPYSPRTSSVYTFTSGYGTAVVNDPNSPNYVGMATEVTGLDAPEVRESAADKPQADGGIHGDFFQGRRPITMTVSVFGQSTMIERDTRIDRLRRATKVYTPWDGVSTFNSGAPGNTSLFMSDGVLSWTHDGQDMCVFFRRQQPVRIAGPWVKEVQVALVSPFNEIFSQTVNNSSGSNNCENIGDESAYPVFRVTGATSGTTVITHSQTGLKVQMLPTFALGAGQSADIDTRTHTVRRNDGTDLTGYIDFINSTWPKIRPISLSNTFSLAGGGSLITYWRHAWS